MSLRAALVAAPVGHVTDGVLALLCAFVAYKAGGAYAWWFAAASFFFLLGKASARARTFA